MDVKNLKQAGDLLEKKVLLRADFNVPLQNGQVAEDFRIRKTLPTINFLRQQGSKTIILSHLQDREKNLLSLAPVFEYLKRHFPEIIFVSDFSELESALQEIKAGGVILLENIRNWQGEKSYDESFIDELASFGDIFVNDAFSVSHREHSSIIGLPTRLPSFAGFLFEEEMKNLSHAFSPEHPFLFIIGGAKTETKIPLLKKFIQTADYVFVGGVLSNDFLKTKGFEVGQSLVSRGVETELSELSKNSKVILARSVVVKNDKTNLIKKPVSEVLLEDSIKDVVIDNSEYLEKIIQRSKFILWNGPMGNLEEGFSDGTRQLAEMISQSSAKTILGGGDTISALNDLDLEKFSFVSTGGGAMLDFLANETLPGIEALKTQ